MRRRRARGPNARRQNPARSPKPSMAAKAGDEVIVGAGTYAVTSPIFDPAQRHQHPDPRRTRVARCRGSPPPSAGPALGMTRAPGTASATSKSRTTRTAASVLYCIGSPVERVLVRVVGNCGRRRLSSSPDCAIRNSLFRVEGGSSIGLRAPRRRRQNLRVGAERDGDRHRQRLDRRRVGRIQRPARPRRASPSNSRNSIAQGASSDLQRRAPAPSGPANIAVTHSNFDTSSPEGEAKVIDGGGNQTAPPLFVDAANGDFREARGLADDRRRHRRPASARSTSPATRASSGRLPTSAPTSSCRRRAPSAPPRRRADPVAAPRPVDLQRRSTSAKRSSAQPRKRRRRSGRPSPTRSPQRRRSASASSARSPAAGRARSA